MNSFGKLEFGGRYSVSNLGNVRSNEWTIHSSDGRHWTLPSKLLTPNPIHESDYLVVSLTDVCKKMHSVLVHRLVACHFVPKTCHSYDTVNHVNKIKTDNRACNLEWCTYSQNIEHAMWSGNDKRCRPCTCLNDGNTFKSINEACKFYHVYHDFVIHHLVSKYDPSCKELQFMFVDNEKVDSIQDMMMLNTARVHTNVLEDTIPSLKNEIWKPVPGYESYMLFSNLGRLKRACYVKQLPSGRKLHYREKLYPLHSNGFTVTINGTQHYLNKSTLLKSLFNTK